MSIKLEKNTNEKIKMFKGGYKQNPGLWAHPWSFVHGHLGHSLECGASTAVLAKFPRH